MPAVFSLINDRIFLFSDMFRNLSVFTKHALFFCFVSCFRLASVGIRQGEFSEFVQKIDFTISHDHQHCWWFSLNNKAGAIRMYGACFFGSVRSLKRKGPKTACSHSFFPCVHDPQRHCGAIVVIRGSRRTNADPVHDLFRRKGADLR